MLLLLLFHLLNVVLHNAKNSYIMHNGERITFVNSVLSSRHDSTLSSFNAIDYADVFIFEFYSTKVDFRVEYAILYYASKDAVLRKMFALAAKNRLLHKNSSMRSTALTLYARTLQNASALLFTFLSDESEAVVYVASELIVELGREADYFALNVYYHLHKNRLPNNVVNKLNSCLERLKAKLAKRM